MACRLLASSISRSLSAVSLTAGDADRDAECDSDPDADLDASDMEDLRDPEVTSSSKAMSAARWAGTSKGASALRLRYLWGRSEEERFTFVFLFF